GMPTAGRHVVVEQEPGARVGAATHREQRGARGQRAGHAGGHHVGLGAVDGILNGAKVQGGRDVERGELVVWTRHRTTSRVVGRSYLAATVHGWTADVTPDTPAGHPCLASDVAFTRAHLCSYG